MNNNNKRDHFIVKM